MLSSKVKNDFEESNMYTLYGIPNCDTIKKTKTFLDGKGVSYDFVNFKKSAPTAKNIKLWQNYLGDMPVNKRGTTFRKIKDDFEESTDTKKIKLLIDNSSAIKRPILEKDGSVMAIGFDEVKAKL